MDALLSIAIFMALGLAFVLVNLLVGKLLRPEAPNREKQAIYECGEPTIGSNWVQFDLRFYVVALFFLVFDVELALIYPWAVTFREFPGPALAYGLPFLIIIIVGYAYEWHVGSLEWVRSSVSASTARRRSDQPLAALARRDPEQLADEQDAALNR